MKKHTLTLGILAIIATTPAHAIYNLYKNDGLSFDMSGEVNFYAQKQKVAEQGQTQALSHIYNELDDQRLRLHTAQGSSWVDFRATQDLKNGYRATGTLGLGYAQGGGSAFLNNANLSIDKLNVGAITFGRQYLHTGYVARTGTFTPLDVFGEQAIRLDYYGIDSLHASAYYLFPSSTDVRSPSNSTKTEGFGASVSYLAPFSDTHSLRLATGYSNNKANPRTSGRNSVPSESEGYLSSAEYRYSKLLLAADYGQSKATLGGNLIVDSKSDYKGIKVGYEVTPKFNLMAGYGVKDTKATRPAGVNQMAVESAILSGINGSFGSIETSLKTSLLYDKLTQKTTYVRGDYYLRDNVRLYGLVEDKKLNGQVGGQDYAKLENTAYRLGVSLTF